MLDTITNASLQNTAPQPLVPSGGGTLQGLSFSTILDTINPLQHIPLVSSVYRYATGSTISDGAKLAGDALYGLVTGTAVTSVAASAADIAVKQVSGSDITGTIINAVAKPSSTPVAQPLVADQAPVAAAKPAAPDFIPIDPHRTQIASGQYSRALAMDSVNKKLVKMTA